MSIEAGEAGVLYIVATPLGNLEDISARALRVLQAVDRIAAEDTRHSAPLLRHFGINTPMLALHEHNERERSRSLIESLLRGESIALISDAGTPLISDPGYVLAREAHQAGVRVVPVPGPSALITALSAAGLPTDRFCFEGFLPAKGGQRRKALAGLCTEPRTLIFYESPHRVVESLADMVEAFGAGRPAVLARELTKTFETIRHTTLGELAEWVAGDENQRKGEIVLIIGGAPEPEETGLSEQVQHTARVLAEELPVKQAAALTARLCDTKKNAVYRWLLEQA